MSQEDSDRQRAAGRPTMRDVALLAGVAPKTVSRVMNGVSTVDPGMAERVRQAAERLGYRRNLTASSLRSGGRTASLGMLVEDAANPYSAALIRAVGDIADQHGSLVLIASLDEDPARERRLAQEFVDRRVDGLVIVPAGDDQSYLVGEQRAGTAMVFVDREPRALKADAVVSDNRASAVTAVKHLAAQGHRRIAYLGDRASISTAAQRLDGYHHALELSGIAQDASLVVQNLTSEQAAITATRQILERQDPPTAVFTSQNLVTIGCSRALRDLGLQERVAMVGFDDFPLADLLRPGVSVVAQDVETIGKIAAQTLFRRIAGDQTPSATTVVPTRLMIRGSGEIPAAGGPRSGSAG